MSDSAQTTACPDAATLRALLDGTLPENQQATTQAHVDQCRVCEAALRQMTAGGESWIGMAQKLKGERLDDPKLAAAMERLKTDDSSGDESNEPADPQRTLDFLQPADDPKLLGKLGQHEISEVVGWGGMGVVLKAYDPRLHRVVAVKVLASHLAHHAVARKRFIREAQAAAAVCHDNVVTIHAIDEAGDPAGSGDPRRAQLPKIIMQFVAGGSLQERIDQEAPLELKEILRIAMQTAAGLAAAHAQGVVHRDVKPANILLENGVQRVKLTDFGLARVMDDASLTLSGVIAGTPQYMAPEQAWGRDVDARADLFSLGAVMYAMCSGHSPFRARTTMAVLKRVCEDAPRPLRAINPDIPDWLVAIIEKLLAKKPEDRFQSATEVSELLSRWLAHVQQPSVVPPPESIVPRGFEAARRNPRSKTWVTDPRGANVETPNVLSDIADAGNRWQLGAKHILWPMLVTSTVLGILLVLTVMETGTRNLGSFLGFSLIQLAATFALSSTFRTAWNTPSWLVWLGAMLFLPAAGSVFWWAAAYQQAALAMQLLCTLQGVLALAFWFALLFVAPMMKRDVDRSTTNRRVGWQRLFALDLLIVFAVPVVLTWFWLLSSLEPQRPREQRPQPKVMKTASANPSVSQSPIGPAGPAAISAGVKPLLGRWVVVSSEGAALGSAAMMGGASGNLFAPATPGGMTGSGFGGGGPATSVASPPLQWIEFADDHVVVFDGREATVFAEFDLDQQPKRLSLRVRSEPTSSERIDTNWRNGIYRLERDRLIVCWTGNSQPAPDEFSADSGVGAQLLVLRREWNPPADDQPRETPPPRAVVPFTADEAKRYQQAWAGAADVPTTITNSIGMKLILLPAGEFDSFQQGMLDHHSFGKPAGSSAMPRPLYFATTEVTVGQFQKFVADTGYQTSEERASPPSTSGNWRSPGFVQDSVDHPIVRVSWEDAQAFCRWLSKTTETPYRLPTLGEWAFAARAGLAVDVRIKPPTDARLKFFDKTAPVGNSINPFGLFDLFGNVGEWTNQLQLDVTAYRGNRIAVGGGFRSSMNNAATAINGRSFPAAEAWLMPRYAGEIAHFDDVGFRVVRDIKSEALLPIELWPQVSDLFATASRVQLKAPKPVDPNSNPNESSAARGYDGPVVVVRGLFPITSLPQPAECVDFEIERVEIKSNDDGETRIPGPNEVKDLWRKLDLGMTLKLLEKSDFATDSVPALLTSNVFTMPLPARSDSAWPKELVTHPLLPLAPPKSKFEVQQQLVRFIDFEVAPVRSYRYRVRLKFTPIGKQEKPTIIFTPWSSESAWVKVEELRDKKEH